MISWISSVSVVISPLSFLILLIWILSLCPLVSLAKGLSFLLIFLKNQFLVLLILSMVLFVSIWLISALCLIISCLYSSWVYLLPFVLELSTVRLLVSALSSFFLEALIAMSFPLSTAFIASHRFGYVVFSFSLNSIKSLISFFFSSLILQKGI